MSAGPRARISRATRWWFTISSILAPRSSSTAFRAARTAAAAIHR
ncbi:hypothetical protein [Streptomyces sp. NPDC015130]